MSRHDYAMADAPIMSERDRLRVLSEIHDPQTVRMLNHIEVKPGARCLEVGPGNGSIVHAMSQMVGPTGRVVAADVAEGLITDLPANSDFRLCDARTDDLDGPYDIIHVRHVLLHLRERDLVLRRLAEALSPGGSLLVEEYFFPWERNGAAMAGTGDPAGAAAYVDLMKAFLDAAGADWLWAQRLPVRLSGLGLSDVSAEGWFPPTTGDDAAVLPIREGLIRAAPKLRAAGLLDLDEDVIEAGIAFASNPAAMFLPYLLVSAHARRGGEALA
jgi:protein-L-isoaspartate O-methyltransferase